MERDWISVKDRLPAFNEPVLLYWNETVCTGACEKYGLVHAFTDGHIQDFQGYVTHWMPLPEPPKKSH